MMWQLPALLALFARAGQRVADKAAIVQDYRIDTSVATFYRNFLFLFFTIAVGYLGWAGVMRIYIDAWVVVLALLTIPGGFLYTYILRKIEVTSIEAIICLSPLAFLAIDVAVLHLAFTPAHMVAIVVLSLGGLAFALDSRTHRFKREFTPLVAFVLLYIIARSAAEFYTFRFLHETQGLNAVSFLASLWLLVVLGLLAIVIARRKAHLLLRPVSLRYVPLVSLARAFDAARGILYLYAISLASVSQVAAIGALEPVVVFVFAFLTQRTLRVHLRERLDKRSLHWKAGAVGLLVIGGLLIS